MSLDLPSLSPQLQAAGRSAVDRQRQLVRLLPSADQALMTVGQMEQDELALRIKRAGTRWSGAIPTGENPAAAFDPPEPPSEYAISAADGSQIYPDRHAAVLYYLINIGSIQLLPGSGQAPAVVSQSQLFHGNRDLYDEQGSLISSEYVNGQRDVAEMAALAQSARQAPRDPCLALLDNGLLLWLMLQVRDQPKARAEELLDQYLNQLDDLRSVGAALAGVMDRPRHGNVLALAHLAALPLDAISQSSLQANPYHGLTDAALFSGRLQVGQRSPIYRYGSPVNERFRQAGHEVFFFYLKSAEAVLLRVEIPEWTAHNQQLLNLAHAGILADSQASGGYPYTLARAHELAVVSASERQQLEELLAAELTRQGLSPTLSTKATTKTWLSGRRSHRL